jgi:DNA-binding response OmpR family regulator
LVAEDHQVSRHLLQRNLANWGFEVATVEDGEQALKVLQGNNPPPIALLDWMMPKMDGSQVCAHVREMKGRPYIYLILLTAKGQKEDVASGLVSGADDYVIKPFDADELRARLQVGERVVALERTLASRVGELETALADVRKLKGLLPICMYCKSIRDDQDYWRQIEDYIHAETGADFSHGICPKCMEKITADLDKAKA